MGITIDEVLLDENIDEALESLISKRDSCGADGVKLSELSDYWNANGEKVKRAILDGTYSIGLVKQFENVNYKGKHRTISLMNSVDRLIYRALFQVMSKNLDSNFSEHSYAYRDGKGVLEAVKQAA